MMDGRVGLSKQPAKVGFLGFADLSLNLTAIESEKEPAAKGKPVKLIIPAEQAEMQRQHRGMFIQSARTSMAARRTTCGPAPPSESTSSGVTAIRVG